MSKVFSETLKELRQAAGYTQKQIYEMIGVPQSTFSSWETGKAEPSADILLRLCDIYGVNDILAAFGYDGYNSDGTIRLSMNECDLIEKYRVLDEHGKEIVDIVLDKEHSRSAALTSDYTDELLAAHSRTDIDHTPDGQKHDLDIMDDDGKWK